MKDQHLNAGIVGQCVVKNTPLRIDDAYQCEYFNQAVDQKTGYKTTSVLAMPVCSPNGKVLGALQVKKKTAYLWFPSRTH